MSIKPDEVRNIAHLARLGLGEDQLREFANDLSSTLLLVDQLNQANTESVEPLANPGQCSARLRDDVVTETDQRENLQAVAPSVEQGFYLVPKVIE